MTPLTKLYISYSSKDFEIISPLIEALQKNSISVFYDKNLINEGESWRDKLTEGLANADAVLIFITENSISSSYVMNELGMAKGAKKLLLPVVYKTTELPEFIRDIQAIFWKESIEEVINSVIKAIRKFYYKEETYKSNTSDDSTEAEKNSSDRRYWLLKLNPNTWLINDFAIGENTFANTYYFGKKRPEFELYKQIKKGDYVLGFATGDYQSIVCQMDVTKPVGPDTAQGEGFEMQITRLFNPHIPIKNFSPLISEILPKLNQNQKPPEIFFKLSETTYKSILSTEGDLESDYENLYQPFYLTEGNHEATEDQLEFENDIDSFASVIALQKVNPPLAIGLFGNWGSGKSFFMEKLSERIERISASKEPEYIENVVQVKFNS